MLNSLTPVDIEIAYNLGKVDFDDPKYTGKQRAQIARPDETEIIRLDELDMPDDEETTS